MDILIQQLAGHIPNVPSIRTKLSEPFPTSWVSVARWIERLTAEIRSSVRFPLGTQKFFFWEKEACANTNISSISIHKYSAVPFNVSVNDALQNLKRWDKLNFKVNSSVLRLHSTSISSSPSSLSMTWIVSLASTTSDSVYIPNGFSSGTNKTDAWALSISLPMEQGSPSRKQMIFSSSDPLRSKLRPQHGNDFRLKKSTQLR